MGEIDRITALRERGTRAGERRRQIEKVFEVHEVRKVLWRKQGGLGRGSLGRAVWQFTWVTREDLTGKEAEKMCLHPCLPPPLSHMQRYPGGAPRATAERTWDPLGMSILSG